jgi:hypothetical protein
MKTFDERRRYLFRMTQLKNGVTISEDSQITHVRQRPYDDEKSWATQNNASWRIATMVSRQFSWRLETSLPRIRKLSSLGEGEIISTWSCDCSARAVSTRARCKANRSHTITCGDRKRTRVKVNNILVISRENSKPRNAGGSKCCNKYAYSLGRGWKEGTSLFKLNWLGKTNPWLP